MEKQDIDSVAAWVDGRLPGFDTVLGATKFAGGQSNPTYRIDTSAGAYVLRRKPAGVLLKSAHAVDREFRVQSALAGTGVPVPQMHLLCEDDAVIGAAFYIMEAVEGRNFDDPRLPELDCEGRAAVVDEMNRVLAAIHGVDLRAAGLSDYGPDGNYFRRQIDRWIKQYRASETGHIPAMEELMSAMDTGCPADDGRRSLVHGDFRLDNLIFAQDSARCAAVLDWELSTLGHPFADLAGVLMQWRNPAGSEGRGLAGVDRAALGLPSDQAFLDAYARRSGIEIPQSFGFYVGFCAFRLAAILQGVLKRVLDGNASNPEKGRRMGALVPLLAQNGLDALGG